MRFLRPGGALRLGLVFAVAFCIAAPVRAETKRLKTPICLGSEVCLKGAAPYEAWELPLKTPARLQRCAVYSSTPFFAVILKRDVAETAELDCDEMPKSAAIKDAVAERNRVQAAFAGNKAFLRLLCTGGGPFVQHAVRGEAGMLRNFLALYAGSDRAKAAQLLEAAKASYPAAELAQMSASIERGDQDCQ